MSLGYFLHFFIYFFKKVLTKGSFYDIIVERSVMSA